MSFDHSKSATHRLAQAAKAHRARSGAHLSALRLHAGQESVLKALGEHDGLTMTALAAELGVQPPTVTKMVTRLAASGFVMRQTSEVDGRLARVFLTESGRSLISDIDKTWKRLEKEALAGFDDKEKRRLKKLLRRMEKNLLKANGVSLESRGLSDGPDDEDDKDVEDAAA